MISETFEIFEGGLCTDGDYHKTMNAERFEAWLRKSIIYFKAYSTKGVVLVLDNAPYHSITINKSPKQNAKKQDLIAFIQKHNYEVPEGSLKIHLYGIVEQIIAENPGIYDQKLAEKICSENGIEVIYIV